MTPQVHHRYATVDGQRLFYREAGPADAPAVVLLHGFPTSSFMFRDLIPQLADRYHVIAPDHLGFGLSDAPAGDGVRLHLRRADRSDRGTARPARGVTRYAIYVQDYGAPIGWRLALRDPQAITAIITQSGNGYDDGFVESFWTTVWDYQREQTPDTEAAIRTALDRGVDQVAVPHRRPGRDLVSPDTWTTTPPGRPSRQRPDPTPAVPRLRHQPAAVPGAARVSADQRGAGTRGVGQGRLDLRPRRCPRVRAAMPQTPRSTCSTAVTSCWSRQAGRSRT